MIPFITPWLRRLIPAALILAAGFGAAAGFGRRDSAAGTQADSEPEIRKCLLSLNESLATRDPDKVMAVFDSADDIMIIGSETGEVCLGRAKARAFVEELLRRPHLHYFTMDHITIARSGDIAWAFADGKMHRTKKDDPILIHPFRITAVLVRRADGWKWKVFSGSIPRGK